MNGMLQVFPLVQRKRLKEKYHREVSLEFEHNLLHHIKMIQDELQYKQHAEYAKSKELCAVLDKRLNKTMDMAKRVRANRLKRQRGEGQQGGSRVRGKNDWRGGRIARSGSNGQRPKRDRSDEGGNESDPHSSEDEDSTPKARTNDMPLLSQTMEEVLYIRKQISVIRINLFRWYRDYLLFE